MVYVEPVGTGRSGRLPDARDYTVATYARLLHHVVDHLGQPRVHLSLRHSHGGFVAQQYALDHPDRLASSSCTTPPPWRTAQFLVGGGRRHGAVRGAETSRPILRWPVTPPPSPPHSALSTTTAPPPSCGRSCRPTSSTTGVEKGVRPPPAGRCGCPAAHREGAPFDVRAELSRVTVPPWSWPEDDFICGPRWARLLGRVDARRRVVGPEGHRALRMTSRQPALFSAAVLGFPRSTASRRQQPSSLAVLLAVVAAILATAVAAAVVAVTRCVVVVTT
ncbi:alpha/beta fold hydrolase [Streptomyces sp. KL116D]|uniref:alpha/beta fold hydrolase n=1 Tax=Streptomyces sp. KL116D TaxID=3045152 RepID=UPI0035583091